MRVVERQAIFCFARPITTFFPLTAQRTHCILWVPTPLPTMPHKPIRLPPLEVLRVKNPKRNPKNPCTVVMSSVLGTFFSSTASEYNPP